jgi:hypothetical protein
LRFEVFDDQLILTPGVVDVETAARDNRYAVCRLEPEIARGHAEAGALHLRITVLEREVVMTARRELGARDLARDEDVAEVLVEHRPDAGIQFGDCIRLTGLDAEEGLLHPLPSYR